MGSKYQWLGPITLICRYRDWKIWFIVHNGNEFEFRRRRNAVRFAEDLISLGANKDEISLIEETHQRIRRGDSVSDDSFRIDVTNWLKNKLELDAI